MRRWILLFEENKGQEEVFAKEIGVSPLLARLLLNRGIRDSLQAKRFLNPKIEDLYDPFLYFPDLEKAMNFLVKLRGSRRKVLIFGDYDVDGITATTIMYRVLSNWGWDVSFYIPHRLEEGYGLKEKSIKKALSQNDFVGLLITVDCGIKSRKEIEYLRKNGVEVIVTDHHIPEGENIPEALLVFNPYLNNYPYPYMAGVGVAFKFLKALGDFIGKDIYKEKGILELVTLGTLGDLMELKDENRILVKFGLEKFLNPDLVGIKTLIRKVGLDKNTIINTKDVIFNITPRINSIGRFKEVEEAIRLLLTDNVEEAEILCEKLDEFNRKRREEVERVYEIAKEMLREEEIENNKVVFLYNPLWGRDAGGVMGIVASMLVEEYNVPFFLGRKEGDFVIFSGRGVEEVNLFDFISNLSNHLVNFGGHRGAVGFSLFEKDYEVFKINAIKLANELWKEVDFTPKVKIDAEISLDKIKSENIGKFLSELDLLPPFGPGNEEPRFKISSTVIAYFEKMGNGGRYKIKIGDISGKVLSTPIFSIGIEEDAFKESSQALDIILRIEKEGYQGREYFNFYLEEWREAEKVIKETKREKTKAILYFLENESEKDFLIDEVKKRGKEYIIVSPRWNKFYWNEEIISPWELKTKLLEKDKIVIWDDAEWFLDEKFSTEFLKLVKTINNPIIFLSNLKKEDRRLSLSDLLGIKNLRIPKRSFNPAFVDARFSKSREKDLQFFEGKDVYFYPDKMPLRVYKYLIFLKPPLMKVEFLKWSKFGQNIILLFGKEDFVYSYKKVQEIAMDLLKEERNFFITQSHNFLLFLQKAKPSEIYSLLV
ncbi:MAG: single-stranded-DNA-specific exonuclease RecJ [Dictyoglomus thermophilum]|nr:single-stranded-DNA-specific exonuclease RecJ [Dictyoglomus thermophilum]MCX7720360.1 single-stranded-DNA-specific exonuclease RecJ [Dictyoglomus thermophilum]